MSGTARERVVEVAGLPVHYREAGAGKTAGKTIVFLHGAGGAPPEGAAFVPMLAARHRLLVPSRPGFDETPLGECASVADVVETMAGFIAATAEEPVHVVAQSAGGAIGCWLAIAHKELVASLVLSAPSAFAVRHAGAGRPSPAEMDAILYGETPSWSAPPDEAEHARIRRNAQANIARFPAPDGNPELAARLGEIEAPTLLLLGTGDRMIPEEAMQPYQRLIPGCRRVLLYGAAHELPISACPQWVRLVGDFVERGEASVVNVGASA